MHQVFALNSEQCILEKSSTQQNWVESYSWTVEALPGGVQIPVALDQGAQQALCSPAAHHYCSYKGNTAALLSGSSI